MKRWTTAWAALAFGFALGAVDPVDAQSLSIPADDWKNKGLTLDQGLTIYRAAAPLRAVSVGQYHPNSLKRRATRSTGRLKIIDTTDTTHLCTAFLVDEDKLITAAHCVFGNAIPVSAEIEMGFLNDVTPAQSFAVDIAPLALDRKIDLALHGIKGKPGRDWGTVDFAQRAPVEGATLYVAHHPEGFVLKLSECFSGPKPVGQPDVLFHKCDTRGGSSGAPIFDETFNVVGVHQAGSRDSDSAAHNRGRNTDVVLAFLDRHITRDVPDEPLANPVPRAAIAPESASTEQQVIVAVPPAEPKVIAPPLSVDDRAYRKVATNLQIALKRVGCYAGDIDGLFGRGSVKGYDAFRNRLGDACGTLPSLSPVSSAAVVPNGWVETASDALAELQSCRAAQDVSCPNTSSVAPVQPSKQEDEGIANGFDAFCAEYQNIGPRAWGNRFQRPSFTNSIHVIVKSFRAANYRNAEALLAELQAKYPEVALSLNATVSSGGENQMYAAYLSEGQTSREQSSEILLFARHCGFPDGRPPIATDAFGYVQNVGLFRPTRDVFAKYGF